MPPIWTADEIKRIGYRVVDLIADHLTTLPNPSSSIALRAQLCASVDM